MRAVEHGLEADRLAALGLDTAGPSGSPPRRCSPSTTRSPRCPARRLRPGLDPQRRRRPARGRPRGARTGVLRLRLVVVDDAQEMTSAPRGCCSVVGRRHGPGPARRPRHRGPDLPRRRPALPRQRLGRPSATRSPRSSCPRHTGCRKPSRRGGRPWRPKIGALGGGRQRSPSRAAPVADIDVHLLRAPCRRRPRSSPPSCARPTCVAACRGPRWRWSSGRGAHATLRRVLMAPGVPVAGSATDLRYATRSRYGRCWRWSTRSSRWR